MHRENHSDPSQEYSFFPEFTELREMDQMVERLTYEERSNQSEYFPEDEFRTPEEPEKEKRKPLFRLLRRAVIVLSSAALLLTVTSRFGVRARVGLEKAEYDNVCLHLTVSGTVEEPVRYMLYPYGSPQAADSGMLQTGEQLLLLESLEPDAVYRIDIHHGDRVICKFLFNTLALPGQEVQPTEAPTEATEAPTEPTEEPTEATTEPTEAPTEPTEETTEPTEEPTEPTEETTEPTEEPTEPTQPPYIPPYIPPETEPTEEPTEPTEPGIGSIT